MVAAQRADALRTRLREATDTLTKWNGLRAKAESVKQTLTRLRAGLPSTDLAALRQEHQSQQAEETALVNAITS